ncbi:di-glucose binding within endoplasmic reticulum family protein [Pelomyxa schiedti]|nr:di-glucose binding within endoplasmic reticulum family protein [Pelomyxa schiedti]
MLHILLLNIWESILTFIGMLFQFKDNWKFPCLTKYISHPILMFAVCNRFMIFLRDQTGGEYNHHATQISKMKMNFIGLHTYPLYEPTVWVGTDSDFNSDGTVKVSYPTSYMTSLRGDWGYLPKTTSNYYYGSALLYSSDCTQGLSNINTGAFCPVPTTNADDNTVFNSAGNLLSQSFAYAHALQLKTCVGTETPLAKPDQSIDSVTYYSGIFDRISKTYDIDYYWVWTSEDWEWSNYQQNDTIVQQAVQDMNDAFTARNLVNATFQLATCGWVLGPSPNRAYFDDVLPSEYILSSIDQQVGKSAVDPAYADVKNHRKWDIPWMEDDPSLTAPQLWVSRTIEHAKDALSYGCEGLPGIMWRTVATSPTISALSQVTWDTSLTPEMFWNDWSVSQFGPDAGPSIASIFESIDSFNLPTPATWTNGPGGMVPNSELWDRVAQEYDFVDKLTALREQITDIVYLDNFDYWLNSFYYMRDMAHVECAWAQLEAALNLVLAIDNPDIRKQVAIDTALPIRVEMVGLWNSMMTNLQATVTSTGELGTIMNMEQHNTPLAIGAPGAILAGILSGCSEPSPSEYLGCYIDSSDRDLDGYSFSDASMTVLMCSYACAILRSPPYKYYGLQYSTYCFCGDSFGEYGRVDDSECNMPCGGDQSEMCGSAWRNSIYINSCNASYSDLPPDAVPSSTYLGSTPRLIIPTPRDTMLATEQFELSAMVLSAPQVTPPELSLFMRLLGEDESFLEYAMSLVSQGRQVYTVQLPTAATPSDFEYYVQANVNGTMLVFPVNVPLQFQTVVVF